MGDYGNISNSLKPCACREVDYTKQALAVLRVTHQSGALKYKTLSNFIALLEMSAEELKKMRKL